MGYRKMCHEKWLLYLKSIAMGGNGAAVWWLSRSRNWRHSIRSRRSGRKDVGQYRSW